MAPRVPDTFINLCYPLIINKTAWFREDTEMMNMEKGKNIVTTEMMAMNRIEGFYNEILRTNDPDYSMKIAMQLTYLQSKDGSWCVID